MVFLPIRAFLRMFIIDNSSSCRNAYCSELDRNTLPFGLSRQKFKISLIHP